MDASAREELNAIKKELNSIIAELESISFGVKNDFVGIGNDQCGKCIDKVISQYKYVKKKLDNLDTRTLTEAFKQATGGGSR